MVCLRTYPYLSSFCPVPETMSVSTGLNRRHFLEIEQATTHHATAEQHAMAGKNNLNVRHNYVLASISVIPLWRYSLHTVHVYIG
jgi:hypothetical protein